MIVVAVIGLLAVVAVPSFYSARKRSQSISCSNQLRQISSAKDQWALDVGVASGTPSLADDLVGPFIHRTPVCPVEGTYVVNDLAVDPTCTAYDETFHPATL